MALPLETVAREYLKQRVIVIKDDLLDALIMRTTNENFEQIVQLLRNDPNAHILEITNYLCEVARPDLPGIKTVIDQLKLETEDKDAWEDFREIEEKLGL